MTTTAADWTTLRDEIAAQAEASCKKIEEAIDGASDLPPLEFAEALEDIANDYLALFEEISERHRSRARVPNIRLVKT
jgi:hypothetical protein